jgi:hypothetical protein
MHEEIDELHHAILGGESSRRILAEMHDVADATVATGTSASASTPVVRAVTVPAGGTVSIAQTSTTPLPPTGLPAPAIPDQPRLLVFQFDVSVLPRGANDPAHPGPS